MWTILFDEEFRTEFRVFDAAVRRQIAAYAKLLEHDGPELGRPWADTLKGSKHPNMKELRPTVDKVEWRVAYAFDPQRKAVVLVAAAKHGGSKFYRKLIGTADARFDAHLRRLRQGMRS
jgi:hypothetical protein